MFFVKLLWFVYVMEFLIKIYFIFKYMFLFIIELYILFYKVKVIKCCLGFFLVMCMDIVLIVFK